MPTDRTDDAAAKPRIPDELRSRAAAADRQGGGRGGATRPGGGARNGPAPGRIVAAAASVSAGLGLMTLMSGQANRPEVIIEVQPAPVVVQNRTVMAPQPASGQAEIRPIEAATPAPSAPAPAPAPVTESEGS